MSLSDSYPEFLCALCVWREARSESDAARRGVWHVIHNRVGLPLFRPTLIRVILQPEQFSSFNKGDPNSSKFPNEALVMDWQAWQEILLISNNPGTDPTSGAVYYESVDPGELDDLRSRDPWFAADKMTAQLGAVRFYRA